MSSSQSICVTAHAEHHLGAAPRGVAGGARRGGRRQAGGRLQRQGPWGRGRAGEAVAPGTRAAGGRAAAAGLAQFLVVCEFM